MPADVPTLERLPGAAGIKVFMGSSTGSLLVEDDEGIAEILRRTRRRAAFHSEDEQMLRDRKDLRVEGDPRSHPVWRSAEVALACTAAPGARSRARPARASTCCTSPPREEMALLEGHKDVASVEVTPHHLTLAAPDGLRAPRHPDADEPAGARRSASRQAVWEGLDEGIADILGSDHAPHTLEEKAEAYPRYALGHDGRADARADHARPRERRRA